jgi:hypothetical protein
VSMQRIAQITRTIREIVHISLTKKSEALDRQRKSAFSAGVGIASKFSN